MCGRYANHVPKMVAWAGLLDEWPNVPTSYNISPGQPIAAFRTPTGEKMRWGLIPHSVKEFGSTYATFNARLETVADKPAFRTAWKKSQRCLIPMLGYYEWTGEKGNKQPYFINGEDGLASAGLYDSWGDKNQLSCTIITKPANEQLNEIHPRMPALLTPDVAAIWLKLDSIAARHLLSEPTEPELSYYPVNKDVSNPRVEGERLISELV